MVQLGFPVLMIDNDPQGDLSKTFLEQIPEETLNERVLKLILQPVIENSINHGFKRCQIRGKILIEAYELVEIKR